MKIKKWQNQQTALFCFTLYAHTFIELNYLVIKKSLQDHMKASNVTKFVWENSIKLKLNK